MLKNQDPDPTLTQASGGVPFDQASSDQAASQQAADHLSLPTANASGSAVRFLSNASSSAAARLSDTPEFEAYATAIMSKSSVRLALFFVVAALLWWPLDGPLFDRTPDLRAAYGTMRTGVIAANAVILLGLWRLGTPRRFLGSITLFTMCAQLLFATTVLASADGVRPQEPMFFYLAPFLSIVILWPLAKRTAAAAALAATVALGFRLSNPDTFGGTVLLEYVAYFAFCTAFATGIGHLLYRVIRSEFDVRDRLARRDHQLRDLADSLEERVRVQTAELRRLNAHIDDSLEAERGRISGELHDELGQQLAAMRFALDFGRRSGDLASLNAIMLELDELLDRTHQTIRGILRGMHPQVLQQLGLVDALRWLGDETTARSHLHCTVHTSAQFPSVPRPLATSLFRCVQEALTNVTRHAQATEVAVNLSHDAGRCIVTVRDNGSGLSAKATPGLGMTGIRERAKRWGGDANWTRSTNGGTTLRIRVPLSTTLPSTEPT